MIQIRSPDTSTYLLTYVLLLALTALTAWLSSMSLAGLGGLETLVAISIAITKGTLIALFFMHLVDQRAANAVVLIVALLLVTCFIFLTAADTPTRHVGGVLPH